MNITSGVLKAVAIGLTVASLQACESRSLQKSKEKQGTVKNPAPDAPTHHPHDPCPACGMG
jgi:hypothetical protein